MELLQGRIQGIEKRGRTHAPKKALLPSHQQRFNNHLPMLIARTVASGIYIQVKHQLRILLVQWLVNFLNKFAAGKPLVQRYGFVSIHFVIHCILLTERAAIFQLWVPVPT